jgi:hypothetical protein
MLDTAKLMLTISFFSEYAIQASAPTWLYGSAFKFQVTRAHGAWAANMRHYNVRPFDSLVFALARDNDIKGIISMIERKEASVYDVDETGEGILHVRILLAGIY